MRLNEALYWDGQFTRHPLSEQKVPVFENVWKRQQIAKRVLDEEILGKFVFEVGVGFGLVAYAVQAITCGQTQYCGIEMSGTAVKYLRDAMSLDVVQASIAQIPMRGNIIDSVWAFDSLEHVNPKDRETGYHELDRIMKVRSSILLNFSLEETRHDLNYDHGFTDDDLAVLMRVCSMRIGKREIYRVEHPTKTLEYEWIVLTR